jgi:hypothetical protein
MAKPETLHCDIGTELWHSFEIGMTDIRMDPIDLIAGRRKVGEESLKMVFADELRRL